MESFKTLHYLFFLFRIDIKEFFIMLDYIIHYADINFVCKNICNTVDIVE